MVRSRWRRSERSTGPATQRGVGAGEAARTPHYRAVQLSSASADELVGAAANHGAGEVRVSVRGVCHAGEGQGHA